jgi:predicted dehydrogenase
MRKLRWGVLSTAKIGREKVIPSMQKGTFSEVIAIGSANKQAKTIAKECNIPTVHESYEALLADPAVEAVYIPLPNHLHVEWAIKSLEAGKHVLCEKPLALSADQAMRLWKEAAKFPELKIMEAFMYRFHPQWLHAKKIVEEGTLGELKTVQSFFSYYNVDGGNIRNRADAGGGGLMDIGCYCISISRFLFGKEPTSVIGIADHDPQFQTDRMASAILDFLDGQTATFTCSTQAMPYQRVNIIGTKARLEIEIPFNAPLDQPATNWIHTKEESRSIHFDTANQYTLQGDAFSKAVLNNEPVPTPLHDAVHNMKVIEAISASAKDRQWKRLS